MLQIYRIVIIGVLCSMFLLASLDRAAYEVNTFTSNTKDHTLPLRLAYNKIRFLETSRDFLQSRTTILGG